ncbi:MAG TPA: glycogen debranching N-terminal domain-containing protein [Streptosporangiaceae bacterium]|nr:glycogen debranching N-terminal domain-containing protein [Streptosporangiaceae bacterium]
MTEPWSSGDLPPSQGACSPVTLIEGSTFCISEPGGDILPDRSQGLFVRDTRILSRWELTVDGIEPQPLSVQHGEPYAASFLGRMPPRAGLADSALLVIRRRYVGDGMREDVTLRNTSGKAKRFRLVLTAEADFADLFEVKGNSKPRAVASRAIGDSGLVITSGRRERRQELRISGDQSPSVTDDGALAWRLSVPGHSELTVSIEAVPVDDGVAMKLRHPRGHAVDRTLPAKRLRKWRQRGPQVRTPDRNLSEVLGRSIEDLGALRIFDPEHPRWPVVAAGAPWFMALFGRDSLLTAWMLLPWDPGLALGTLRTLAAWQGNESDAASEEEPGKILHEVRFGPAASFALGGRSAYYGSADATPLFVMLLGELQRWGAKENAVAGLLPHADRALDWIATYGDADGDGFVEYFRKTSHGLVNQGWKDSWDGINFADGTIAEPPIALAEVQAYVYAAYRARAQLAKHTCDERGAAHWRKKAKQLKRDFNERFWLPDRGWYAVGLDAAKRPIDSLTSNIGHCLWTGIADKDKAASVARHLMSGEMFSGWGIRTLASSMGSYNPMSYHNGSVWPHDNAICAAGLMRYGYVEQAQRVTSAIVDAAASFGYRLPELFCGFGRDEFASPVPYPTSCSPQAWAAGAPLLLLHSLLRFTPDVGTGQLWCAPEIPDRYLPLRVSAVRVGKSRLTVAIGDGKWEITGLEPISFEVIPTPQPARSG